MITVYQLPHGGLELDPRYFFDTAATRETRGHPWKLMKPRAVSRIRRNAFSIRVINDWNSLPAAVVSLDSLNQFKSRCDSGWPHTVHITLIQITNTTAGCDTGTDP